MIIGPTPPTRRAMENEISERLAVCSCGTPLICTFAWSGKEWYCLNCGRLYTFFGAHLLKTTPELWEKYEELRKNGKRSNRNFWAEARCSKTARLVGRSLSRISSTHQSRKSPQAIGLISNSRKGQKSRENKYSYRLSISLRLRTFQRHSQ